MHVCVITARARVLWLRPDIYCNYYVRAKFKPGGAPGCYDARGNTGGVWYMVPYSYTTEQRSMVHGPLFPYSYTCTEEYGTIPIPVQRSMVHGPLFLYLYRGVWYMVPYSYTTVERSMVHGPLFLYLYRGVWYMVPYSYTTVQRSMVHSPPSPMPEATSA